MALLDHYERKFSNPASIPFVLAQPTWHLMQTVPAAQLALPDHWSCAQWVSWGPGVSSFLERWFTYEGQRILSLPWAKGGHTDPNFLH